MQDFARKTDDCLTQKQIDGMLALLNNSTIRDAARAIEVDESTVYRWLQQQGFRRAYMEMRRELVRQAIATAQRSTGEAVNVLKEIMNDTDKPGSARIQAAKTILEFAIKASEVEEMEERIAQLEKLLGL